MTHNENNWHGIDLYESAFKGLNEIVPAEDPRQPVSEICHTNGTLVFEASDPDGHSIRVYHLYNEYYYSQFEGPNAVQSAIGKDSHTEERIQETVDDVGRDWTITTNTHSFSVPF